MVLQSISVQDKQAMKSQAINSGALVFSHKNFEESLVNIIL